MVNRSNKWTKFFVLCDINTSKETGFWSNEPETCVWGNFYPKMLQTPVCLLIFLLEIVLLHSNTYFTKYEICASMRFMLKVPGEMLFGSVIFHF